MPINSSKKREKRSSTKLKVLLSISSHLSIEADLLRNKVRAMSKMMKMFKTLREENEVVV
jgi:hypothetical protein